ncbi:hypothetical protein ACFLTE_11245, partial [Bacteroidota bacterium]
MKKLITIFILVYFFLSLKSQNIECEGNSISIPLSGYKIGDIQWQFSNDSTNWTDIIGQTNTYLTYNLSETGYIRAKVSYGSCDYYSDTAYIEVYPEPTVANTGSSQYITTIDTILILEANTPLNGKGKWSIISGDGGSFENDTLPTTTFTGLQCNDYALRWTISTKCKDSYDNVNIGFHSEPTIANAGEDQYIFNVDTVVTLSANIPILGKGKWSIISGDGGSFENDTLPTTTFTGLQCYDYVLRWTISTKCKDSYDNVNVGFHPLTIFKNGDSVNIEYHGKIFKDLTTPAGLFIDSIYYGLTRTGRTDAKLFIYNTKKHLISDIIKIDSASGAWAIDGDSANLYIATYSSAGDFKARLFHYDILTKTIQQLAVFSTESFAWALIKINNVIYIGTYPNAKVYSYDLNTNILQDFGRLSDQKYVRTLKYYNKKLYAGIGAIAELVEVDLQTGQQINLLPSQYKNESLVSYSEIIDSFLIIGLNPSTKILLLNLSDYSYTELCDSVHKLPITYNYNNNMKTFSFFGKLLFFDKQTQNLFQYKNSDLYISRIYEDRIVGFSPEGIYRELGLYGDTLYSKDIIDEVGIHTSPMCIEVSNGKAYLGGKRVIKYDIFSKIHNTQVVNGEAKTMKLYNNFLYSSHYPGAYLYKFPINNFDSIDGKNDKYLIAKVNNQQDRPHCSVLGNGYYIVGSSPEYGLYGGALTFMSLNDYLITVFRNLVENHIIYSLALDSNILYIGTSVYGGTGTIPLNENAHLLKMDMNSHHILFDTIPKLNNKTIKAIVPNKDFLTCLLNDGSLVKTSASTGETLGSFNDYKFISITNLIDGRLFACTSTDLYEIKYANGGYTSEIFLGSFY